jgi:hypothetical protein
MLDRRSFFGLLAIPLAAPAAKLLAFLKPASVAAGTVGASEIGKGWKVQHIFQSDLNPLRCQFAEFPVTRMKDLAADLDAAGWRPPRRRTPEELDALVELIRRA